MPRQYVDNAYNRSVGRVGMTHGTAVISKSSGGGGSSRAGGYGSSSSSTSNYYGGGSSSSSSPKVYVDNAMNRNLGRVGLSHGSAVHSRTDNSSGYAYNSSNTGSSSGSSKVYVDNALNKSLGRVGLEHGSAVHFRSTSGCENRASSSSSVPAKSNQGSYSSSSSYVNNELNRRLGRVGLEKGSAVYSKSEQTIGSMPKTYVDNAYNRQLGRAGQPIGSAVHTKSTAKPSLAAGLIKTYVYNALNIRLGRAGKPFGSMPVSKTKSSKKFDFNINVYPTENGNLPQLLENLNNIQREEIQDLMRLNQARNDHVPKTSNFVLKSEQVILFDDLKLGDKIGGGGFGDVHVALWQGHQVAVKKLRVQRVSQTKKKQFEDEVRSISDLDHPHVVKFYGACIAPPNLAIVMEFLPDGSLYDNLYYYDDVQFDEKTKNQFIWDALSALVYIHSMNMVHRDIKSRNVMLCSGKTHCKLADFGLALKDDTETNASGANHCFAGTEKYCPKEVIEGQWLKVDQLKRVDVYSLALTIVELLTEIEPYEGYNIHQIRKAIKDGETPSMEKYGISSAKEVLLKKALSQNAIDRPTAGEFLIKFSNIIASEI